MIWSFHQESKTLKKLVWNNPELDLNISVFALSQGKVYPMETNIRVKNKEGKNVINLLRVSHKTGNDVNNGHYVLIKDLDGFLARRSQTEDRFRLYKKKFCPQCQCQFTSEDSEKYQRHRKLWSEISSFDSN